MGGDRDFKFGKYDDRVLVHGRQIIPKSGVVRSLELYKYLVGTNHISATAEDRVVKFCTHVGDITSHYIDYKSPLKGEWSGSCDPF